ncbi:hypothetical protein [Azospirillum doebereinerae]
MRGPGCQDGSQGQRPSGQSLHAFPPNFWRLTLSEGRWVWMQGSIHSTKSRFRSGRCTPVKELRPQLYIDKESSSRAAYVKSASPNTDVIFDFRHNPIRW